MDKLTCFESGPPEPARIVSDQNSNRFAEAQPSAWSSAANAAAKVEAARSAAQGAWAFARAAAFDAENALMKAQKAMEKAQERRDAAMRKDRISAEEADKAHWALSAMGYQLGEYDTDSEDRTETEEILSRVTSDSRKSFSVCHASEEIEQIKTAADGRMDIVKTTRTGTVMSAIIENADARIEEVQSLKQQLAQAKRENEKLQLILAEKDRRLKSTDHSLVEQNEELMSEVGRLQMALLQKKKAHRSSSFSPGMSQSISKPESHQKVSVRATLKERSRPAVLPPADLS